MNYVKKHKSEVLPKKKKIFPDYLNPADWIAVMVIRLTS
jgi:hypothetical protein